MSNYAKYTKFSKLTTCTSDKYTNTKKRHRYFVKVHFKTVEISRPNKYGYHV